MSLSVRLIAPLAAALIAVGCSHHDQAQSANQQQPAATGEKVHGPRDTFTGEIVRRNGKYCFKPLDQGETIWRLTRAANPKEFADDEMNLRKYYGKILVVKAVLRDDWLATAEVVGQWTRPGEPRGPTLTGPEPR